MCALLILLFWSVISEYVHLKVQDCYVLYSVFEIDITCFVVYFTTVKCIILLLIWI